MDLLLAEDDEDLGQAVVDHLVAAGHCLRWYRCIANAEAAAPWEMALLDLRLGDGDGTRPAAPVAPGRTAATGDRADRAQPGIGTLARRRSRQH